MNTVLENQQFMSHLLNWINVECVRMIAESKWNWFLILVNCEYKAAWSAHVVLLHQKKNSFKTGEWRTKIKRKSYLCVQYLLVYQLGTCITLNDKQLLRIRFNYISVSYRDRYNPYIHRFRFSIEKKSLHAKVYLLNHSKNILWNAFELSLFMADLRKISFYFPFFLPLSFLIVIHVFYVVIANHKIHWSEIRLAKNHQQSEKKEIRATFYFHGGVKM